MDAGRPPRAAGGGSCDKGFQDARAMLSPTARLQQPEEEGSRLLREQQQDLDQLFEDWLVQLEQARKEFAAQQARFLTFVLEGKKPYEEWQQYPDEDSATKETPCSTIGLPDEPPPSRPFSFETPPVVSFCSEPLIQAKDFHHPSGIQDPSDLVAPGVSCATPGGEFCPVVMDIDTTDQLEKLGSDEQDPVFQRNSFCKPSADDEPDMSIESPSHHRMLLKWGTQTLKEVSQVLGDELLDECEEVEKKNCLQKCVQSLQFKLFCSLVILVNAAFIGIRTDQKVAKEMRGETESEFWGTIEIAFCVFFLAELLLRATAEKLSFIIGPDWKWNGFDSLLVSQSLLDLVFFDTSSLNLTFARTLRIFRFVRILRLVRVMKLFSSFRLMVYSILGSMLNLLWVFLLLYFVIYFFAIFFLYGVTEYYDTVNEATRSDLRHFYGSVEQTMITLFGCITGGDDWSNPRRPLEELGRFYSLTFVLYIFFMVLGLLNVVVGTFVETAAAVSERDHEAIIANQLSQVQEYSANIQQFFSEADKDKSGNLSWEEFERHLKDDRVKAYFNSLDLDVSQARVLFSLLDVDETGEIGIQEFLGGCMRLKGGAKSIDVNMLLYETEKLFCKFGNFTDFVKQRFDGIEQHLGIEGMASMSSEDVKNPKKKRNGENLWTGSSSFDVLWRKPENILNSLDRRRKKVQNAAGNLAEKAENIVFNVAVPGPLRKEASVQSNRSSSSS